MTLLGVLSGYFGSGFFGVSLTNTSVLFMASTGGANLYVYFLMIAYLPAYPHSVTDAAASDAYDAAVAAAAEHGAPTLTIYGGRAEGAGELKALADSYCQTDDSALSPGAHHGDSGTVLLDRHAVTLKIHGSGSGSGGGAGASAAASSAADEESGASAHRGAGAAPSSGAGAAMWTGSATAAKASASASAAGVDAGDIEFTGAEGDEVDTGMSLPGTVTASASASAPSGFGSGAGASGYEAAGGDVEATATGQLADDDDDGGAAGHGGAHPHAAGASVDWK